MQDQTNPRGGDLLVAGGTLPAMEPCCSAEEQAACCEPAEKAGCCGTEPAAGGGCGCQ